MGVVYREHSRSFPVSGLNLSLLETELGTMRFKTVPLPIHPFFWRGFFIFRKILKIYLINTDFYLQHSSQWEARVSSGISSMLLFDWRSLCWIRDVVVYRTPIQHEWNPPLPDGAQQWFVWVACSPTNINIHVSQYPNDCLEPNNKITEVMRCSSWWNCLGK